MKKIIAILIAVQFVLLTPGYSQGINLGIYNGSAYQLQTDQLRLCSTVDCLYIHGQDQLYVEARIIVSPQNRLPIPSEDVLSYSKFPGYSDKKVLFLRDGTKFVLLETITYDINGNQISAKDETQEEQQGGATISTTTNTPSGTVTKTETGAFAKRRIAWSNVFPGTPGEAITRAVLAYANDNYAEIDASSQKYNFIKSE